jgi:hypothetical protein
MPLEAFLSLSLKLKQSRWMFIRLAHRKVKIEPSDIEK